MMHKRVTKDAQEKRELKKLYNRNCYLRVKDHQKKTRVQPSTVGHQRKAHVALSRPLNIVEASHSEMIEPSLKLFKPHKLKLGKPCQFCRAIRFQNEPAGFCCAKGQIPLACPNVPEDLYYMFTSNDPLAEEFRSRCRAYNSVFSFTLFWVNYDTELANYRHGVYTFRVQGQVYHSFPSLTPTENVPRFLQLYFYDTDNEVRNRMGITTDAPLSATIVEKLMVVMSNNPYARLLRTLRNRDLENHKLTIRADVDVDQCVYNKPTSDQVVAVWIEGNNPSIPNVRDIIVYGNTEKMHKVNHYYSCYDPLQYPILHPYGEVGWHQNLLKKKPTSYPNEPNINSMENIEPFSSIEDIFSNEQECANGGSLNNVSCRAYYCYKLQIRDCDCSILLYARRLLHQYIVDMYIKVECTRLDFFRKKQNQIRADLYQGIVDSVVSGEVDLTKVGKRIVLPASFVGGPKDMKIRYLDAIALVSKFGKPDLFLTMTCNPEWPEIKQHLKNGQTTQDRPDLAAMVFQGKIQDLKKELFTNNLFGTVAAHVHVIEFQKRGLHHCHLLIILNRSCKRTNVADFDTFVSTEIPDPEKYPDLYNKVIKHMMHGPCGVLNPKNVCMIDKQCKNHYPLPFFPETMQGKDSYPIYRQRDDGRKFVVRGCELDNRWVVPYNPYLLSRYDCHINVEICSGIRAVKYLYKYIYKGHDKVVVNISEGQEEWKIDEINQFQDARWVSAHEAALRLFGFNLNEISPAVINLQLHLPNQQTVTYFENQNLQSVLQSERTGKTTLTEFFSYCRNDPNKEPHLYGEFPEKFTWNPKDKVWTPREHKTIIGRINSTTPSDKERYYLRLLLSHVRSPTSYEDLLYFNSRRSETFKEAAEARGLLQSDNWLLECLADAVAFQMPTTLRRLFATILVFCEATDVKGLWDRYYDDLSEDFGRQLGSTPDSRLRQTLQSIDYFLDGMGKNVTDFPLPAIVEDTYNVINSEKTRSD